jgi:hypothetical protein
MLKYLSSQDAATERDGVVVTLWSRIREVFGSKADTPTVLILRFFVVFLSPSKN